MPHSGMYMLLLVRVTALRVTEVVICSTVPLTGLHNVPANTMLGGCVLALCAGTTPSWTVIVLDSTCTPIALTFKHVSVPSPYIRQHTRYTL